MGQQDLYLALQKALMETGERMIFREIEGMSEKTKEEALKENDYQISIPIEYPFKGQLFLFFEREASAQIVTEMLGEPVQNEDQIKDGLAELGNTISGRFLKNYSAKGGSYEMGLPRCSIVGNVNAVPLHKVWAFRFDDLTVFAGTKKE